MGRNVIQFQKGLSVPEFLQLYGTERRLSEKMSARGAALSTK
jgi:hypothetical protein